MGLLDFIVPSPLCFVLTTLLWLCCSLPLSVWLYHNNTSGSRLELSKNKNKSGRGYIIFTFAYNNMGPRPTAAILRWLHHRNSSDYRELQESILGCGVGLLGKSPKSWRTVPGLILEDDSAICFDDLSAAEEAMRCKSVPRSEGGAFRRLGSWSKTTSSSSKRASSSRRAAGTTQEQRIVVEDSEESKVFDSHSIETTETEDESEQEEQQSKMEKSVRWADQDVIISIDSLPYVSTRVVILLLDLNERLFEFVQCEFDTDNRLTITDVLKQIPSFASIDYLAQQRFRTICRPNEEFLNMLTMQNYQIREGEILIASGGSARPKEVMAAASTLLEQKKLVRAVQKAKLSGRALQRLLSSAQLAEALEKGRQVNSPEKAALEESADAMEYQDMGDSALIVKVLSRELGEDLLPSEFVDFSFLEAEDAFMERAGLFGLESSTKKDGPGWFDELLATSFDDNVSFDFSPNALPDLQESTHEDIDIGDFTSEHSCDDRALDAFESGSHAWSVQDAVVPDFSLSFPAHQPV